MSYKRNLNRQIYDQLSLIISSYENIIEQLIRQSITDSYTNNLDDYDLALMDAQIDDSKKHISYLRDIQYWTSVIILSDGSLAEASEVGNVIEVIDIILEITSKELKDKNIADWAADKIIILDQIRDVLSQILQHKIKVKNKRGEITIQ